ncbi:hypothetical protein C0992_006459 [Termitomyces sp. T32_za158]|nr:hypothetical protein C0992_006459 [Termitomyces sp. T32_za158]
MERRSKRLRTTSQPNYSVDLDSDADIPDPDAKSEKATKAKRKSLPKVKEPKPKRAVRGRRGKLEQITRLPLDILFEIFSLLDPIDILNLSRTSKPLRAILMRRSSIYVWRNARARFDGLPECPSDMSLSEIICQFEGDFMGIENKNVQANQPYKTFASLVFLPYDDFTMMDLIPTCSLSMNNNRIRDVFVDADTLRQYQDEKKDLRGSALDEWFASKRSDYEARAEVCRCMNTDMPALIRSHSMRFDAKRGTMTATRNG